MPHEPNHKVLTNDEYLALINKTVEEDENTSNQTINDIPFIGGALASASDIASGVKKAFTGEDVKLTFKDAGGIDDIEMGFWEDLVPSFKGMFTRNDAGKAEIIKDTYAGDERFGGAFKDDYNNPFIIWNKKPFYINKPGFDNMDFNNVLNEVIKFYPATKLVSGAKSLIQTIGRGVPAYGTTETGNIIAEEIIAPETSKLKSAGDRVGEVAVSTGIGTAVDAVMPGVAKLGGKAIRAVVPDKVLEAINLPRITEPIWENITKSKYPLTKGAATTKALNRVDSGDAQAQASKQIMEEDRIRYSKDTGSEILTGFDADQLALIRQDAESIIKKQGSGRASLESKDVPIESATSIKNIVTNRKNALKKQKDELYESNDLSSVSLTPEGVNTFANTALKNLEKFRIGRYVENQMPLFSKIRTDLKRIAKISSNPKFKQQPFSVLRDYQEQLNTLRGIAFGKNPASKESSAIGEVSATLNDFINDGIDNAFIVGDQEVIDQLLKANKTYRQYMGLSGKNLRGGDGVESATNAILKKLTDPRLDADAVVNKFFGHSKFQPASVMNNVLTKIQKNVPEKEFKEVIALVKDGVLTRAFSGKGTSGVTRTNIINNYDETFKRNQNLISRLFSKDELKQIEQFKDNVLPTLWAEIKMNPANSGNMMMFSLMSKGVLNYAGKFPLVDKILNPKIFEEIGSRNKARDAIAGYMERKKAPLFSSISQAPVRTDDETLENDEIPAFLKNLPMSAKMKILNSAEIDNGGGE